MVVSLDPTEEQYWTLQIVLCQELLSMIHDKAKKPTKLVPVFIQNISMNRSSYTFDLPLFYC